MSEKVARLAVQQLRLAMFPSLPDDVQTLFPKIQDTIVQGGQDTVPNIVVGEYSDYGARTSTPMIAVHCEGPQEGIVNVFRHLSLSIDIWIDGTSGGNVDGRRIVSIIYEYVNKAFQNINWSGSGIPGKKGTDFVQIKRCYEIERSQILFEETSKIYRIANIYRVEALSQTWY